MRDKIIGFINDYLSIDEYKDYTINGLQVEGKKEVNKILFSVSYSSEIGYYAAENRFDLIIVHHGIITPSSRAITGVFKKRIEPLIKNDINLACYHLPLDAHRLIGNNITIIKMLSCKTIKPFAKENNKHIGFIGIYEDHKRLTEIEKIIRERINPNPLILRFGNSKIKKVAVITGAASSYIYEAIKEEVDLFITGEAKEEVYNLAKDTNINFIAAGHTHTEVFGLQNLQKILTTKFKMHTQFLPSPNPI